MKKKKNNFCFFFFFWLVLNDNAAMFGLNNENPLFDKLFNNASAVWKILGVIKEPIDASEAKDDSVIKKIYKG